jgi:hypothetical protein
MRHVNKNCRKMTAAPHHRPTTHRCVGDRQAQGLWGRGYRGGLHHRRDLMWYAVFRQPERTTHAAAADFNDCEFAETANAFCFLAQQR